MWKRQNCINQLVLLGKDVCTFIPIAHCSKYIQSDQKVGRKVK